MYRLLRYSLASKTYLPTSRHILSYTYSTIKDKIPKDTDQVPDELDNFLENCVYKDRRQAFKLLRQTEKTNFNLKIANEVANKARDLENESSKKVRDLENEITKKDKEQAVTAVKTGHLNLNYLRLKGAVHLRGVFEQWELYSLSSIEGNRGTKWTKYLNENKDTLEIFKNFYSNPNEIHTNHVVAEIKSFYKWLSERIHNAYAVGDYLEWSRNSLTPVRNKVAEFMCKELNLEYRIVEPSGEEFEITTGEVTLNKDTSTSDKDKDKSTSNKVSDK